MQNPPSESSESLEPESSPLSPRRSRDSIRRSIASHAEAIANMILDESGIGDLSCHLHRRQIQSIEPLPPKVVKLKRQQSTRIRTKRKITEEIRAAVNLLSGSTPAQVVAAIEIQFKKSISTNTVYVIWREAKKASK